VIKAGNDVVRGGLGDDMIVGDGLSLYTETIPSTSSVGTLSVSNSIYTIRLEQKFEPKHLDRGQQELRFTFEMADNTQESLDAATTSYISNDRIYGNAGADILFGQEANDYLQGDDEGADAFPDVLLAGRGLDQIESDGMDSPVQLSSDNFPKLAHLARAKQLVLHAASNWFNLFSSDLVSDISTRKDGDLMFDVLTGNYLRSDESVDWNSQVVYHNLEHPRDTNADNQLTPLDALQVINALNEISRHKLPVTLGSLEKRIGSSRYLDVNNDATLSTLDALIVINGLNA